MKDKTLKLQRVQNVLKSCEDLAKANREKEKEWVILDRNNAFCCHMLASAYDFIAQSLKRALEDDDEKSGVEN